VKNRRASQKSVKSVRYTKEFSFRGFRLKSQPGALPHDHGHTRSLIIFGVEDRDVQETFFVETEAKPRHLPFQPGVRVWHVLRVSALA